MKYDVLLVAAALDELSKESQTGSLDSAQIVVNAFHSLEPCRSIVTEVTHTKKGGSTQGQTDLGNMSVENKDEEVTDVRGVKYTRVGKWKIWRVVDNKKKNISRIWFVHFLSQRVHEGTRDREFFIEYDENLVPKGFAYMGERRQVFHLWFITILKRSTVIVFGEVCDPEDGVSILIF
jgi:hypothetical protein